MRVNTYQLLSDKIEEGIRGGLIKAEKRGWLKVEGQPGVVGSNEECAVEEIHNYIMNAICEIFNWNDEHAD